MYTLKKFLVIYQKLLQKIWCIEVQLYIIFNNISQKVSSKNSFLWESGNDQKNNYSPWVLCHCWLIWLWSHPTLVDHIIAMLVAIIRNRALKKNCTNP
jgi:hypothetical protein